MDQVMRKTYGSMASSKHERYGGVDLPRFIREGETCYHFRFDLCCTGKPWGPDPI
jgi:hypothetical protein